MLNPPSINLEIINESVFAIATRLWLCGHVAIWLLLLLRLGILHMGRNPGKRLRVFVFICFSISKRSLKKSTATQEKWFKTLTYRSDQSPLASLVFYHWFFSWLGVWTVVPSRESREKKKCKISQTRNAKKFLASESLQELNRSPVVVAQNFFALRNIFASLGCMGWRTRWNTEISAADCQLE